MLDHEHQLLFIVSGGICLIRVSVNKQICFAQDWIVLKVCLYGQVSGSIQDTNKSQAELWEVKRCWHVRTVQAMIFL